MAFSDFLRGYWGNASYAGITVNNAANIPDALKQAMVNHIVSHCLDGTVRTSWTQHYHQQILNHLYHHQTLLGNAPQNLTYLRELIGVYAELTGVQISSALSELTDENYFVYQLQYGSADLHLIAKMSEKYYAFANALQAALSGEIQASPAQQQLRAASYALALKAWSEEKYRDIHNTSMPGWEAVGATADQEKERAAAGIDPDVWIVPDNIDLKVTPDFSLGKGGFGEVFRAIDNETDDEVAVKLFHPGANLSVDARGELELIKRLKDAEPCDYIVKITGISLLNARYGMVMEFVPGGTLYHHLHEDRSEAFSWVHRLQTAFDIALGMEYLHAHNIVHADMKSGNVLLTGDEGHAKLTDFGLSRVVQDTTMHSTQSRAHISNDNAAGTMPYKAPECFGKTPAKPSKATVIWALGLVLWEIVARRRLFESDCTNEAIIIYYTMLKMRAEVDEPHPLPTVASVIEDPEDTSNAQAANDPEFEVTIRDVLEVVNPVIIACRSLDPVGRPTATAVVHMLDAGIKARQNLHRFFGSTTAAAAAPPVAAALVP